MMRYLTVIGIGVLVVLVALFAGGRYLVSRLDGQGSPSPVACTKEAKICPDGSSVERTGPNCEFAPCAAPTSNPTPTTGSQSPASLSLKFNESRSALGVTLTPVTLLEDSRCPSDVQCIQAGTVRIQATVASGLGTATQEFKLGVPVTTEAEIITLIDVHPIKVSTHTLTSGDYLFEFNIVKR